MVSFWSLVAIVDSAVFCMVNGIPKRIAIHQTIQRQHDFELNRPNQKTPIGNGKINLGTRGKKMKEFERSIVANFRQVDKQGKIFAIRQHFDLISKNFRRLSVWYLLIEIFLNEAVNNIRIFPKYRPFKLIQVFHSCYFEKQGSIDVPSKNNFVRKNITFWKWGRKNNYFWLVV